MPLSREKKTFERSKSKGPLNFKESQKNDENQLATGGQSKSGQRGKRRKKKLAVQSRRKL